LPPGPHTPRRHTARVAVPPPARRRRARCAPGRQGPAQEAGSSSCWPQTPAAGCAISLRPPRRWTVQPPRITEHAGRMAQASGRVPGDYSLTLGRSSSRDVERWWPSTSPTPMPLDLVIGDTTPSPSWPRSTCSKSCPQPSWLSVAGLPRAALTYGPGALAGLEPAACC